MDNYIDSIEKDVPKDLQDKAKDLWNSGKRKEGLKILASYIVDVLDKQFIYGYFSYFFNTDTKTIGNYMIELGYGQKQLSRKRTIKNILQAIPKEKTEAREIALKAVEMFYGKA